MGQNVFAPPSSEGAPPSLNPSASRFVWAFTAWALLLAILNGGVSTVQAAEPLAKFGGLEYVPRVTSLSIVRERGPGAAATALLFALIVWSHPVDRATLRARLLDIYPRALMTSLLSLPLVTALSIVAAMLTVRTFYGVHWSTSWTTAMGTVVTSDLTACVAVFGVNTAIVGLLSYLCLPPLVRRGWSLTAKITAGWVALFVIRMTLSGIISLYGA